MKKSSKEFKDGIVNHSFKSLFIPLNNPLTVNIDELRFEDFVRADNPEHKLFLENLFKIAVYNLADFKTGEIYTGDLEPLRFAFIGVVDLLNRIDDQEKARILKQQMLSKNVEALERRKQSLLSSIANLESQLEKIKMHDEEFEQLQNICRIESLLNILQNDLIKVEKDINKSNVNSQLKAGLFSDTGSYFFDSSTVSIDLMNKITELFRKCGLNIINRFQIEKMRVPLQIEIKDNTPKQINLWDSNNEE